MDPPAHDPADHAEDFSRRWAGRLDEYCAVRMEELGVPREWIGAPDYDRGRPWRAFDPEGRTGGTITSGIVIDSGCLNPELLKGRKGGRLWARAPLRDRIDAVISHEYEEARVGTHADVLKTAARTALPITDGARRINRAISR